MTLEMDAPLQFMSSSVADASATTSITMRAPISERLEHRPAVSVAVCTLNGRNRVGMVLDRLAAQDICNFELILIDNNSTDGTSDYFEQHPATTILRERGIRARVFREPRQGLLHARLRGMAEAQGPIVCFLDDDNLPSSDYLAQGLEFFRRHPVSLACSRVSPAWATVPPPAIERRRHLLAINDTMADHDVLWPPGTAFPPTIGAGLWVSRDGFSRVISKTEVPRLLPDRTGSTMLSGGDIELGHLFSATGLVCGYAFNLRIEHLIPASRLTTRYFLRLIVGIVRSQSTLELKYRLAPGPLVRRFRAIGGMLLALGAIPLLLLRRDPLRELLFVFAARWAKLRGPYAY